ncbi:MAG: hypothetical protein HDR43_01955 [Mycoplasma sp.]|nr:hypothetical protein [Mycoplasma sp.]
MKLKLISSLIISTLVISPISLSVSCISNGATIIDSNNVYNAIKTGNIKISIENKDNNPIKINELSNVKFTFSIDTPITDNDTENKYYDEIKNSLNKSEINLISYFIPKLNEDNNSSLIFEINKSSNYQIEVPVNLIYNNNEKLQLTNLNGEEIKELIKTKLNEDKEFVIKIRNSLSSILDNNINNIDEYWNQNKNEIELILTNFMYREYSNLFNSYYKNLFISLGNITVEQNNENNTKTKVIISDIKISTSEITTSTENDYYILNNITIYL